MEADEFDAMVAAEERHWWHRGRRRIVREAIERIALPPDPRLLDAGCGSGRVLDELRAFGRVSAVDVSEIGVARARARGYEDVHVAPLEELPWPDATFDLVTCLDVIEHVPDDAPALAELRRVTRPGGHAVVTVPAYPRLWSQHDVANQHFRRYTRSMLRTAAEAAGWSVTRMTNFNALLLPVAAAVIMRRRGTDDDRSNLSLSPRALNGLLEVPLRAEAALLRRGWGMPLGLSLLAVLRRR
jgi:SAM-dependent methyltransferase